MPSYALYTYTRCTCSVPRVKVNLGNENPSWGKNGPFPSTLQSPSPTLPICSIKNPSLRWRSNCWTPINTTQVFTFETVQKKYIIKIEFTYFFSRSIGVFSSSIHGQLKSIIYSTFFSLLS